MKTNRFHTTLLLLAISLLLSDFTLGQRGTNLQIPKQRSGTDNITYISLECTHSQKTDMCAIYLEDDATQDFDGEFDAYKFMKPKHAVGTKSADDQELSINALPYDFTTLFSEVHLDVTAAGEYILRLDYLETFDADIDIFIIDTETGIVTDASLANEYFFTIDDLSSDYHNRLKIMLTRTDNGQDVVAGLAKDLSEVEMSSIQLFPNPSDGQTLHINNKSENGLAHMMQILDSKGRVWSSEILISHGLNTVELQQILPSGMYFLTFNHNISSIQMIVKQN